MNAKRKKILSTYRLIVYEDGSTDLIPDQIFLEKPKEDDKEEKKVQSAYFANCGCFEGDVGIVTFRNIDQGRDQCLCA